MNKKLELKPHLTQQELKEQYTSCRDAREARRWHALWLFHKKDDLRQVGDIVDMTYEALRQLVHRYNEFGVDGVYDGHVFNGGGREAYLSEEQQQKLKLAILTEEPPTGGLWNGRKVALWIEKEIGKPVKPQTGNEYINKLKLSAQTPRPKSIASATPEVQEEWKKKQ
jgi:transposase